MSGIREEVTQVESVALWKRVSSDVQDISNQDDTLNRHVTAHGYDVKRVFELPDTSAFKFKQAAALAEALADVKAGRYTHVVAVTSSRFLRSDERIGVGYLLELDSAGGRLESCDNPLFGDLSNAGGWHVTVAALGGDFAYSKLISDNVNRGFAGMDKDEMRENGYIGAAFRGAVPAGYSIQGGYKNRYLVPDTGQPESHREGRGVRRRFEAEVIRQVFMEAATNTSTVTLGRRLGMRSSAVAELLRNPIYGSGRHEIKRERDGRVVVHRCEPLVDMDVQRAAVALIEARYRGDNITSRAIRKDDFSTVLWCPCCDVRRATMQRYYNGARTRADGSVAPKTRRYKCKRELGGCGRSVDADQADREVERLMSGRAGTWLRQRVIPGDDHAAEKTRVRDELDQLGARRLNREEMRAETERLYDLLDHLEAMPSTPTRTVTEISGISEGDRWRAATWEEKQAILRAEVRVFVSSYGPSYGVQALVEYVEDDE